jgi:hypothetical protein
MQKRYKRRCKCCGEPFETNRSDKYFLNRSHQVRHNNQNQSDRRNGKMTKGLLQTYKIYNDLLSDNPQIKKSKEFLKGRGANLALYTHVDVLDRKKVQFLFDIAIIDDVDHFTLKRKYHD